MTATALNKLCLVLGLACFIFGVCKANAAHKFWLVEYKYQLHLTLEIVIYLVSGVFITAYNLICIAFYSPNMVRGIENDKPTGFAFTNYVQSLKLRKSGESYC